MSRKLISAIAIVFCLAMLVFALSALPGPNRASAERLAQPSPRPPLFGSQTAQAGGGGGGGGPPPTSVPPTTSVPPASPTPAPPTRVRPTRTPTAAPNTATPITIIVVVTATPGPIQPTDSPTPLPPTTPPTATPTSSPASPTTVPPTAYPSSAEGYPAASAGIVEASPWLWAVALLPFVFLVIALWWLFRRRYPLYPGWGRPRRGSRRIGRRYARRRSFPF